MTVSEKPTLDALRELRTLLEDPDHWTTGAFACDELGRRVNPSNSKACRWCLTGGIYKVAGDDVNAAWDVIGALASRAPWVVDDQVLRRDHRARLENFNDYATHAQVLDVIDRTLLAYEAVR